MALRGKCAGCVRGTVKSPTRFSEASKGKSGWKESHIGGHGLDHWTVVLNFGSTSFTKDQQPGSISFKLNQNLLGRAPKFIYFGSLPKNFSKHPDLRITEEKKVLFPFRRLWLLLWEGWEINEWSWKKKERYDLISIFKGSLFLLCFK